MSELSNEQLFCRLKGHAWRHVTDRVLTSVKKVPTLITAEYQCTRCNTGMEEKLKIPSFELVSRKYDYQPGYLLSKKAHDGQRIDIRDIRHERLVRAGVVKR